MSFTKLDKFKSERRLAQRKVYIPCYAVIVEELVVCSTKNFHVTFQIMSFLLNIYVSFDLIEYMIFF